MRYALRKRLVAGVVAAGIATACIERDAYLELTFTLPTDATVPPRYAVIEFNTSAVPFADTWQSAATPPSFQLSAATTTVKPVSVEGTPDIETTPVRIKVLFCVDPLCAGLHDDNAPEVDYEIQRAFYIGQRTSLALSIACIPNVPNVTDPPTSCPLVDKGGPNEIDKCAVAGCVTGETTNYCVNGVHFCEM